MKAIRNTLGQKAQNLAAEFHRRLAHRQLARELGLTAETAPDVMKEALEPYGSIEVRALAEGEKAELVLDGPVWPSEWAFPGEISPANVRNALDELGDVKRVDIYLNSPGGDPYSGHAIHGMLRRFDAEVYIHIEGIAASAASIMAVGADKLVVLPNSTLMIHSASTLMIGWFNSQELRKEAAVLEQVDKAIVAAYAMKTGRSEDELRAMVEAETWMVGQEIVDEGFADVLAGDAEDESVKASAAGPRVSSVIREEDIEEALETAGEALDTVGPSDEGKPADFEPDPDDEKLKLLALELELSTTALF